MAVEIRETKITSAPNGDVVQLYISDAERESVDASFVLQFHALLPKPKGAVILEQLLRDALKVAPDHLSAVRQEVVQRSREGLD